MAEAKRVMIIGASGFVGSHTTEFFRENGYRVAGTTRNPGTGMPTGVERFTVDRTSLNTLNYAFSQFYPQVVIDAGHAFGQNQQAEEDNIQGTLNVIEAASRWGVNRVVYISSGSVYGRPVGGLITEKSPALADTPYGRGKVNSELHYREQSDFELTILRPMLVWGPGDARLTGRIASFLYHGIPTYVNTEGLSFHSVYVKDLALATALAAESPRAVGQTYNVTDEPTTWREFSENLGRGLGYRAKGVDERFFRVLGLGVDGVNRLFNKHYIFDTRNIDYVTGGAYYSADKIKEELGWEPQYNLARGMREVIDWYKQSRR